MTPKDRPAGPEVVKESSNDVRGGVQPPILFERTQKVLKRLEAELGSAEIFTALFELELAGRVRQLPGKNYVRSF